MRWLAYKAPTPAVGVRPSPAVAVSVCGGEDGSSPIRPPRRWSRRLRSPELVRASCLQRRRTSWSRAVDGARRLELQQQPVDLGLERRPDDRRLQSSCWRVRRERPEIIRFAEGPHQGRGRVRRQGCDEIQLEPKRLCRRSSRCEVLHRRPGAKARHVSALSPPLG